MQKFTALMAACGLVAALPAMAQEGTIVGTAKAVDGDTISMTGTYVRLFGIDAPERQQSCKRGAENWGCGEASKQRLAELVTGQSVRCEQRGKDRYGRVVAICFVGRSDLARAIVEQGLAIALPEFSEDYVEAASRSRHYKLGIWAGEFQIPADWRAAHPVQEQRKQAAKSRSRSAAPAKRVYKNRWGCAIKGNRNRRGQWIYHLPGMPYYERTRPEDLFCTEAAALAAGYRRAIVR